MEPSLCHCHSTAKTVQTVLQTPPACEVRQGTSLKVVPGELGRAALRYKGTRGLARHVHYTSNNCTYINYTPANYPYLHLH